MSKKIVGKFLDAESALGGTFFMNELQYPFDPQQILKKRKSIKKELLNKSGLITEKIAILGGSTTHDIKDILELFL